MIESTSVSNLEENERHTRKVIWFQKQIKLAEMRVPQNRVSEVLKGKSVVDLANLAPQAQSLLLIDVAHALNSAKCVPSFITNKSYDEIHALEWNGEEQHPTWKWLDVEFKNELTGKIRDRRKPISWITMSAARNDGAIDNFTVFIVELGNFKRDISPIFSMGVVAPGKRDLFREWKRDELPVTGQQMVAQILDFSRGVRGGLKVVERKNHPYGMSSSDD
jgi:hypothetical protein